MWVLRDPLGTKTKWGYNLFMILEVERRILYRFFHMEPVPLRVLCFISLLFSSDLKMESAGHKTLVCLTHCVGFPQMYKAKTQTKPQK